MPTLDRLERIRDFAQTTGVSPRVILRRLEASGEPVYRDPHDSRRYLADREALSKAVELIPVSRVQDRPERAAG